MERLRAYWEQAKTWWQSAALVVRVGILTAVAAALTLGGLALSRSEAPPREVLFANLSEDDAAHIVERLREQHVDYQLEDESTITVPSAQVHELRLQLAADGMPSGGGVGFELFDTTRFGESEFAEQVQYRRALEGELSRTIRSIAGVESARVHLVLPQRSLFTTGESRARASVAVHLRPGVRLEDAQVRGIRHLVSSSVRDLAPDDVTLVDGEGRPLAEEPQERDQIGDAEDLRRRIEETRTRAVQDMLDATLGPGVAVATVSADITFSREEHVEEVYDPERSATRSFQITDEGGTQDAAGTQGVPGAVSALPGGAAAEATAGQPGDAARRVEVRNFEITKVVHRAVEPIGRLTRLSAAAMVDGRWEGEGSERHFVPRSAEEMERIRALVASAAGINTTRGDQVTVECVPFGHEAPAPPPTPTAVERYGLPIGIGVIALAAVAGGLIAFLRRRRRLRLEAEAAAKAAEEAAKAAEEAAKREAEERARREAEEKAKELLARPVQGDGEADDPALPGASAPALESGLPYEVTRGPIPEDAEELRRLSLEIARAEPAYAARVIQMWLREPAVQAEERDADAA